VDLIKRSAAQYAGDTGSINIHEGEHPVSSTLDVRLYYSVVVPCFVVCGHLRAISSSLFQIKLDTPFSFLKSNLCEKGVSMFTQWAWSQSKTACLLFLVLPLCVSQSALL
jgi:hypothetical protein